ncbi:hypothetical protein WMY93_016565 [Mugilogobius chulae]|uniref:Uncharacterized protein n=1 Tax=Mugilogobius chulae TaxID=88201 RepID=A0AAW0NLW6_9GOBI
MRERPGPDNQGAWTLEHPGQTHFQGDGTRNKIFYLCDLHLLQTDSYQKHQTKLFHRPDQTRSDQIRGVFGTMEAPFQRRPDPRQDRERRRNAAGQFQSKKDEAPESRKEKIIYYTLLFLRVALWLGIAWALSYLHMGAPCFLLAVLMWVYSEPLKRLFSRARRPVSDRSYT